MGDLLNRIKNIFGINKKKVVAPVPENEQLTSPALLNWYANQQSREELARRQNSVQSYITPTPTAVPTRAPTPTPAKRPIQAYVQPRITPAVTPLESKTAQTFEQYGIPKSVAYGIASAEGGRIGKNNIWNINAVDSNPQAAYHYPSLEAAATASAELLLKMVKKQSAQKKSPRDQLKAIEASGYAGDPKTWKKRSKEQGGAGRIYDYWSDFVMDTPGWKKWYGLE